MKIIKKIIKFFSRLLNKQKKLSVASPQENSEKGEVNSSNTAKDVNSFRNHLIESTNVLSKEELKEKLIRESILPNLDSDIKEIPTIYDEIYKVLNYIYAHNFSNLESDKPDSLGLINVEASNKTVDFKDTKGTLLGRIRFIIHDDSGVTSVENIKEPTTIQGGSVIEILIIKDFDRNNIELARRKGVSICNQAGEIIGYISESPMEVYYRDKEEPQKVGYYVEDGLKKEIDLTFLSGDIATLDGVESPTTIKHETSDSNNLQNYYYIKLRNKIRNSKYFEGFPKSFPDFFEKYPEIKDLITEQENLKII